MNAMVLIMVLVCGEPTAIAGWGIPAGIGPFFGTLQFAEKDEQVSKAVNFLYTHPDTEKVAFEVIADSEKKYKCGVES